MKQSANSGYDVIVIGAGPSGMMAAGTAASRGKKVLLIEKNKRLGEKLRISGGGRCNITNAEYDLRALLKRYGKAEPFLYSPFSSFGVQDTFDFFTSRGLPLVVEALNRAFPYTHNADDVESVMEEYCKKSGVTILTNSPAEKIISQNGKITGVIAKGIAYTCDSLVLATGGMSHPETGSTGDGFGWLRDLGHSVEEPTPSIVPISIKDAWVRSLAGITAPNIKISFFANGTRQITKKGSVLFTHFGMSGPLILNSATAIGDLLHQGTVTGTIDLFPADEFNILDQKILDLFSANKNKIFRNVFKDILPAGMSVGILTLVDAAIHDKKVHSVTKEERRSIIHLMKALPFTVKGLMGYDRAVVADGGVSISEVDTRTMRSLKIENLFMTGDLLHINRPTGGFSLQLCWTTGYVTGMNA